MHSLVFRGDARHLPLPDGCCHLVVTSPPYNARVAYDGYDDWLSWEKYWGELIVPALRECHRVLAHGGRIAVNLANVVRANVPEMTVVRDGHYDGKPRPLRYRLRGERRWNPPGANGQPWAKMVGPELWRTLGEIGFLPREQIVWVKAESADEVTTQSKAWGTWRSAQNPVLRAVAEPVYVASKGSHAREPGKSDLTREEFLAWTRNVWFIPLRGLAPDHPAQFPPELARRLVKLFSYVGDTVLDPFCGAGNALVAASQVGRVAVGCDLSLRYCRQSRDRASQLLMSFQNSA